MEDDVEFRLQKSPSGNLSAAYSPGLRGMEEIIRHNEPSLVRSACDAENDSGLGSESKDQGSLNRKKTITSENEHCTEHISSPTGQEETFGEHLDDSRLDTPSISKPTATSTPTMAREGPSSGNRPVVSPISKDISEQDRSQDTTPPRKDSVEYGSEDASGCDDSGEEEVEEAQSEVFTNPPTLMVPGSLNVPILGYETIEARSKFTVYKIQVCVEDEDQGWFIFRRYSDFECLNEQLRKLFPNVRLTLPPKRWFRSNFDLEFLEERKKGLQEYLNNVTGHRDICNSEPVREFFCFDDPPGPHDTVEESKAQCECLEEMNYLLKRELTDKESELSLMKEELELYKNQVQLLTTRLSELNQLLLTDKSRPTSGMDIDALFGDGPTLLRNKLPDKTTS